MWIVYHTSSDGTLEQVHLAKTRGEAHDVCTDWCARLTEDGAVLNMLDKNTHSITETLKETTPDGWVFSGETVTRQQPAGFVGIKSIVQTRPLSPIIRELPAPPPGTTPSPSDFSPVIDELKSRLNNPDGKWFGKQKKE